jgi:hypothetical protein
MLSLVIVVIIVANIVLWNYQMNQLDWERMREDLKITEVSGTTSSWLLVQGEYVTNIGTKISGTYRDTQAVDDRYESFIEGLNWWNLNYSYRRQTTIVNNALSLLRMNYSVNITMDTASLVSAGKILSNGNDLRVAYWSSGNWTELDREVKDMNSTTTQIWFETQSAIAASGSDNNYFVYYGSPTAGSPPTNQNKVYLWFDDFNRADNPNITTEPSYNVKTGGGIWSIQNGMLENVGAAGDPNKLIIGALGNVSSAVDMLVKINVTSFVGGDYSRIGLSCSMDIDPSSGSGYCSLFHSSTSSLDLLNDMRSWGTYGTYSWSLNTWYYMRFRVTDPSSRLGKIKVWPYGTSEPTAWTVDGNFGSGTARNWGSIGFAGSRTTDTTCFDDIVIRYATSVEPTDALGTEEGQVNNILDVNGSLTFNLVTYPLTQIETVEMQIRYRPSDTGERWYLKAYNWTLENYSDSGFNSTAGNTPASGWNTYALNLTDSWQSYIGTGGTMYVKFTDGQSDPKQTTIDIDYLTVRVLVRGTAITVQNTGSLTAHLVSLWISNSTSHQRYDLDTYVNSGCTAQIIRSDITLPSTSSVIKIVTEKGNTAVFSGH